MDLKNSGNSPLKFFEDENGNIQNVTDKEAEANYSYSFPFFEDLILENWTFDNVRNNPYISKKISDESIRRYLKENPDKYKSKPKKNIMMDRISQAEIFHHENPFFYDRSKIWWKWNKIKFRYEKSDEVDILGINYEQDGAQIIKSKERSEIINSLKHIGRKNIPENPKDCWVQFDNLIVDISNGEQFEATPKYFMTNPVPYRLGKLDDTPNLDRLFGDWIGEENVIELYELVAFAQAPKYFIHRIFCLIGSGANGKSTFLTILRKYLGDDNVVSSSLESLMKVRFEGSKLYKKLVCLMGETNFGTLTTTDYIKGLSGEDKLRVEFKGKDSFDCVNNAKLILATNSLPATADKTDGFYRRWKIINFNNKFKEEKDVLSEIPEQEYNNLALKLLKILMKLWKKRVFTDDGNFEERKEKYEAHSNPINLFLNEYFVKDINSDYSTEDFRDEFSQFLNEKGFRELSPRAITQQLQLNGFEIKQLNKQINGKRVNRKYILGLKKQNVSDVSDVSDVFTEFTRVKLNETSDTSDTSDTIKDNRWDYEQNNDFLEDLKTFSKGVYEKTGKDTLKLYDIEALPYENIPEMLKQLIKEGRIQEIKPEIYQIIQ